MLQRYGGLHPIVIRRTLQPNFKTEVQIMQLILGIETMKNTAEILL